MTLRDDLRVASVSEGYAGAKRRDFAWCGLEKAPAGDRKEAGPAGYELVRRQLEALSAQQCYFRCYRKHHFARTQASRRKKRRFACSLARIGHSQSQRVAAQGSLLLNGSFFVHCHGLLLDLQSDSLTPVPRGGTSFRFSTDHFASHRLMRRSRIIHIPF